jgi:hypothetical protein
LLIGTSALPLTSSITVSFPSTITVTFPVAPGISTLTVALSPSLRSFGTVMFTTVSSLSATENEMVVSFSLKSKSPRYVATTV